MYPEKGITFLDYNEPKQNEAEQLYQHYLRAGRDDPTNISMPEWSPEHMMYIRALQKSASDREGWGRPPNFSIPLRNAQHALVSQVAAQESPVGKLSGLGVVPAYNFFKLLAQKAPRLSGWPSVLDALGDKLLDSGPHSLTEASPPSWEAIKWGLRPWWGKD